MDPLGWLAGHLTLAAVVLGIAAALGALAGLLARVGNRSAGLRIYPRGGVGLDLCAGSGSELCPDLDLFLSVPLI
jgi:hypothetical protein